MSCNDKKTNCGCTTKVVCSDEVMTVSHGDTINLGGSGPVLVSDRSFAIPACGEQGKISVIGEVQTPPAGTQAYVAKDGKVAYLTVIGSTRFYAEGASCGSSTKEAIRTELTVLNNCLSCTTLDAGTFLDEGSPVLLNAPDCSVNGSGTSDLVLCDLLHVPEVGETEVIQVSPSTSSLEIGDVIQITDKKFSVVSVPSSTTVEIENQGEGGDPGTIINGSDCESVKIFIIAGDNPCAKTPVTEADHVRVCDGNNDTILDIENGQVVGKVGDRIVGVNIPVDDTPRTTFEGCIVLNPDLDPQEYPLIVDDIDAGFEVGDIGFFDCDDEERRFEITEIDGNVFTLVPQFEVNEVVAVSENCEGCEFVRIPCCEILDNQLIKTIASDNTCGEGGIGAGYAVKSVSIDGNTLNINGQPEHTSICGSSFVVGNIVVPLLVGSDVNGPTHTVVVNNPSSCRSLALMYQQRGGGDGALRHTSNNLLERWYNLRYDNVDQDATTFPQKQLWYIPADQGETSFTWVVIRRLTCLTIAAGGSKTLSNTPNLEVEGTLNAGDRVDPEPIVAATSFFGSTI